MKTRNGATGNRDTDKRKNRAGKDQACAVDEFGQRRHLQNRVDHDDCDGKRGPFVRWLLTMARNRALDQLRLKSERQRRREDQIEDQTEVLPPVATMPDFEGSLDEKRRASRVHELMASLNPQQKKAIELAYFEGLTHSEIANTLKEPLGTVKSWIRNGLLRLKEGLQATS